MGSPAGDVWVFVETLTGAAAADAARRRRDDEWRQNDQRGRERRARGKRRAPCTNADGGARAAGPRAAEVSLELLGQARVLADRLGARTGAVCAGGEPARALAPALVAAGADTVYLAVDDSLIDYLAQPYSRVVSEVVRKAQPQIVLFGASPVGRDLAPRIASELRAGLTADCTDLQIGDHSEPSGGKEYKDLLYQIRPAFGGNIIATIVCPETRPQMATVREGVIRSQADPAARRLETQGHKILPAKAADAATGDFLLDDLTSRRTRRARRRRSVDLRARERSSSAAARASAARTTSSCSSTWPHAIGGVVGASRSAVDSGCIPKITRSARPAPRCARSSTSRAASPAPCSTAPAWRSRPASSPSTPTRRRRSSRSPTTASSATCTRSSPC